MGNMSNLHVHLSENGINPNEASEETIQTAWRSILRQTERLKQLVNF